MRSPCYESPNIRIAKENMVASPRQTGAACAYNIEVLDTFESFIALGDEWPGFLARCEADHPFNTHRWLTTWWEIFGSGASLKLIVARKLGQLVCCIPLTVRTRQIHGVNLRYRTCWVNTHSFRSGILCDVNHLESLVPVFELMVAEKDWDITEFLYLPCDLKVHDALKNTLSRLRLLSSAKTGMDSPRLHLNGTWEVYLSTLSRSRRETVKRKARKVLDRSNGRVRIVSGRTGDLAGLLDECWEISRETWKHRGGSSIASDKSRTKFYERIAQDDSDWIVLGVLYLDDVPVAFEYDLLYKATLYNMKLGYDERYSPYSPGYVLRVALLRWAFENDVNVYDYMGFAQDYKSQFSTQVTPHENIRIYSKRSLPLSLFLLEEKVKPLYRRLRTLFNG